MSIYATYTQDEINEILQPLVEELRQYKKITVGPYEYRLGGRDGNLISRNTVKEART